MDISFFSQAYAQPAGSPIRELFPYLSRPGMISLAGGYPSPSLFDMDGLQEAGARALAQRGVYQYGPTEGDADLRERLCRLCAGRGIHADPPQVLVTTGSQQAFDLLVRTLIDAGDTVLVESPAYPATLQALRLAGAHVVEVPTDAQGLLIDALAQALAALLPARRPKLLYTVPSFSNPGGTLLSAERRQQLVGLAQTHGFLVVEDDPYGDLDFTGQPRATLYQHGQELAGAQSPVVYLSSLSKTVAPALRSGWMIAPPELLRRCAIAKQTMDLCTPPITQRIASEYLRLDRYGTAVARASAQYQARMTRMVQELRDRLDGQATFVAPEGGLFLWLELGPGIDSDALFAAAVAQGVLYVPGKAFYASASHPPALRLSFAAPTVDEVSQGIARLQQALGQARC